MKGADQCPRCASRKFTTVEQGISGFYARTLTVCGNCGTAWEAFAQADLLDMDLRYSSFREPCDNCAFRPGSNEQQDLERWKGILADCKENGGRFYCHKGVPLALKSEDGFDYPKTRDGRHDVKRLRPCRGYLRMLNAQFDKLRETAVSLGHAELLDQCEAETVRSIAAGEPGGVC